MDPTFYPCTKFGSDIYPRLRHAAETQFKSAATEGLFLFPDFAVSTNMPTCGL